MTGARAFLFILLASARNMARHRLRRMREPRYLVASLFGVFYVVSLFWQPGMRVARSLRATPSSISVPLRVGALTWLAMLFVVSGWIFGGDEGGISFSDAEIQFLFPAPFTRRQLVAYKLARSLFFALVSAAFLSVTLGRRVAPDGPFFFLGAWLGIATLSIHLVAASLTRQSLVEHGLRGALRRAASLVIPVGIVASVAWTLLRSTLSPPTTWGEAARYFSQLLEAPPLAWVGMLFAPAARVAVARTAAEILPWAPIAAATLVAHLAWAFATDAAFEEASLRSADRRSYQVAQVRRGQLTVRAGARPPFRLAPGGHPAVAVFWKNLTAASRVLSVRTLVVLSVPGVASLVSALATGTPWGREVAAAVCLVIAGSMSFFGVQVYRIDFRFDLENIDLLRSFPIRGAELALAEILAPFSVLAGVEALGVGVAALLAPASLPLPFGRWPLTLAVVVLLWSVTLPGLIVQNGLALLFPAWVEAGAGPPRGVEAVGQRMLTMLGTLVLVTCALLPAAVIGGAGGFLVAKVSADLGLVFGALGAAGVVAAEAALGVWLLGRAFDRFDG